MLVAFFFSRSLNDESNALRAYVYEGVSGVSDKCDGDLDIRCIPLFARDVWGTGVSLM